MNIEGNHLPGDVASCHALITELVKELDVKDRRLRQLQHQLEQLLRWRYGQKRELRRSLKLTHPCSDKWSHPTG